MSYNWIPQIGLTFSLGIDKFTAMMLGLTLIVTILITICSSVDSYKYYFLITLLFIDAMLLFMARDLLLFYILFEFLIIPFFFLIGKYSGAHKAAMKYLLYSFAGGVVMLVGIIVLYNSGIADSEGGFAFSNVKQVMGTLPMSTQAIIFISLFIGLAIKAPMFPLHSWLKTTVENSQPPISALLVSVFDKMGTFGMLYILIDLMPGVSFKYSNIICLLAIISLIYGAFVALAQKNLLSLIAFSSISHFGFIILGIFSFNSMAIKGAKIYMLAHGLTICALFLIASFISQRESGSFNFDTLKGLQRKYPYLSVTYLIATFSLVAVPGTITFPAEFMIIVGTFQVHKIWAGLALFGAILGALYALLAYQNIFTGANIKGNQIKVPSKNPQYTNIEKFVPLFLVVLIIAFGFIPMVLV